MEKDERIELLQWLIGRSDAMRASYSNRAALILNADAIVLAAIVFLLDKNLNQASVLWGVPLKPFALLSVVFMLLSFALALLASITSRNSRKMTGFKGERRTFLSPKETFTTFGGFENFDAFKEKFKALPAEDFIIGACGELWVDLRIQQIRYRYLKFSALFIFLAFLMLVIALLLAILG